MDDHHGEPGRVPGEFDKVLGYVAKYHKPKDDFKASLYYNVNMDENKTKAKDESADFLQKYYREIPPEFWIFGWPLAIAEM